MIREELLQKTLNVLEGAGYTCAMQYSPSCFDLLARNGQILLVKVLTNIDSLYEEQANDLKRIAEVLNASPILVGLMGRGEYLKEHTIYERHGIPAVIFETFSETVLNHRQPFVYAQRGGFYAHINADFLKKMREKNKFSLGDLSREAGVSKKAIQNYESGQGAEVENILRLQDALGDLVLDPIDVFEFEQKETIPIEDATPLEKGISGRLGDIGFKTASVTKASFKMVSRNKEDVLFTGLMKQPLEKKAQDIHEAADTLEQHGMFVFQRKQRKSISGVPVIEKEELEGIVTSRELVKLLKELSE